MNLTLYGGSRRHFEEDTSERHPELFEWMLRDHPAIEVRMIREAVLGWKSSGGDFFVWCNSELLYDQIRKMSKEGDLDYSSVKRVWYSTYGGKFVMPMNRHHYWDGLIDDVHDALTGIQMSLLRGNF